MAITIPATAQVVCSGVMFPGEVWANVFHVSAEPGDFEEADAGAISAIFENYYNSVKGRRSNAWSLTQITARDIREEAQPTFLFPISTVVGTSGVVPFPAQVSMVVTLRTATNSRRGRGRTFLNGLISTALNSVSGQFSSTVVENELSDFGDLCGDLIVNDSALVVTSRTGGVSRKVETLQIDSVPDTQRRRVNNLVANYKGTLGVA